MIPGAVYLNEEGGIPIAATLERHPSGVRGVRQLLAVAHGHPAGCGCATLLGEIHWMIRPDGSVGCTPGWRPHVVQGKLVMFVRAES